MKVYAATVGLLLAIVVLGIGSLQCFWDGMMNDPDYLPTSAHQLTGRVIERPSGSPIREARIRVHIRPRRMQASKSKPEWKVSDYETKPDSTGRFTLTISPYYHDGRIEVSAPGYEPFAKPLPGGNVFDVHLARLPPDAAVVRAFRIPLEYDPGGMGWNFSDEARASREAADIWFDWSGLADSLVRIEALNGARIAHLGWEALGRLNDYPLSSVCVAPDSGFGFVASAGFTVRTDLVFVRTREGLLAKFEWVPLHMAHLAESGARADLFGRLNRAGTSGLCCESCGNYLDESR